MKKCSTILSIVLVLVGCALPPQQQLGDRYVPLTEAALVREVNEGLFSAKEGRFIEAEFSFRRALVYSPDNSDIQLNLATVLGEQQLYGEAKVLLRRLLLKNPRDMRVLGAVARLAASEGDYESAERFYRKILEVAAEAPPGKYAPIRRSVLQSLSTIAFRIGKEEEAVCYSEEVLRDFRMNLEQSARHANLLLATGRLKQMQSLIDSLELTELPMPLLYQQILLSFERGEDEKAASLCEGALVQGVEDSRIERDCLWIIAMSRKYVIGDIEELDMTKEQEARGFTLPWREYEPEDLFTSYRLIDELLTVQGRILADNENKSEIFAFPGEVERTSLPSASKVLNG